MMAPAVKGNYFIQKKIQLLIDARSYNTKLWFICIINVRDFIIEEKKF